MTDWHFGWVLAVTFSLGLTVRLKCRGVSCGLWAVDWPQCDWELVKRPEWCEESSGHQPSTRDQQPAGLHGSVGETERGTGGFKVVIFVCLLSSVRAVVFIHNLTPCHLNYWWWAVGGGGGGFIINYSAQQVLVVSIGRSCTHTHSVTVSN